MNPVFFRVVADWAGVKWSRASSAFEHFGDANREAMRAAGEGRNARVYAFATNDKTGLGTIVAEYHHQNGRAISISV